MRKRHTSRGPRGLNKRIGVEWAGGIISMPSYVMDESEPYRPEVLVWMDPERSVIGSIVAKPGETLGMASESLQHTIERPSYGHAHMPARVRVASPQLAEVLRAGHPSLEIVCAPTPEIDEMGAHMRAHLWRDGEGKQSYLSAEVGPDAVASLFRAAATLFRAQPWKIVPSDQSLFSVTIEKLGVRDAVMSVIGQAGQGLGLLMFSDIDDFEAYGAAADNIRQDGRQVVPPHFALSFERGAELDTGLRKEIAEHQWEVAGANAYPRLVAVDDDLIARSPSADEFTIFEAMARGLSEVVTDKKTLRAAWKSGDPLSFTISVRTHAGAVEISLRTPYEQANTRYHPPYDVLADLAALGSDGDEVDPEARGPLEDEMLRRFLASPEAEPLSAGPFSDVDHCRMTMGFAATHFGKTIATLGPAELEEIVFEIIPRQVSIEASAARSIIEANRALYTFLKRAFAFKRADPCLRVLGRYAAKELQAALEDSSNFGPAKSMIMAGRDAGFDMETQEGLEAWMQKAQSMPLPTSVGWPPGNTVAGNTVAGNTVAGNTPARTVNRDASRATGRAKKNKRRAARKARTKNR